MFYNRLHEVILPSPVAARDKVISKARLYLSYEVLIANVCPFLCSCGPPALSPLWGCTLLYWYWLFCSGVFRCLNVSITSACKRIIHLSKQPDRQKHRHSFTWSARILYGCSSMISQPDAGPSEKPRCQSLAATFSTSDLHVALLRA